MSGYDGHRVHPRRRMAAAQARQVPAAVEAPDHPEPAVQGRDASANLAEASEPEPEPEPAPPSTAAEFVAALALAMAGVSLAEHTGAQLDDLRRVLAVAAPGITLTDPDPEEPPVPTTDTAETSSKLDEVPVVEPQVDDGRAGLDAVFAELATERAATAQVRAERDRLLAEAADPVRATARAAHAAIAARQQVADEAAVADLREAAAFAQRQTTSAVAHRLVALARTVLTTHGLPATQADALASIPPELAQDVPLTGDRQLDAAAAHAVLDAAARARLAAPR